MNIGNMGVIGVGATALLAGVAVLLAMVRYDLGPRARLERGGWWLLATALGTGMAAFALKLGIILAVANLPGVLVDPLITRVQTAHPARAAGPSVATPGPRRYVWQRLPSAAPAPAPAPVAGAADYPWRALPEAAPAPAGNPTTPARVALGERLFFDRRLSRDGTVACASCHEVPGGGADGRPTSIGIDGRTGGRNAPTVWNAAFQAVLFWDGRAASLEEQARGPLVNPLEMGMPSLAAVEERVRQDGDYREAFTAAFGPGEPITIDRITAAIAAYERTLITPDAPYDRFVRGELDALTPAQLRGMALFQAVGCVLCHSGPNFSAASVFEPQAPLRIFPAFPTPYETRYGLTEDSGAAPPGSPRGSWRVPSLRNVALTGPWFHNGSVTELEEAVRLMANVQLGRTGHLLIWSAGDRVLREVDRPELGEREIGDLVAFLHALSSDRLAERTEGAGKTPPGAVSYPSAGAAPRAR